jgi:hypothetical protein
MQLFTERGARMLVAVLIARLPGYVYLNVGGTDYLGSRHFIGVMPLLCLVCATSAVTLGRKLGRAAPLAALCVAALFAAEARPPLRFRFTFQEEYAFLRRVVAALPANATIANIQFEFGLSPAESSLRLLRPDVLWIDFGNEHAPTTRFAYLGPDCHALLLTNLELATQQYLDPTARLSLLENLSARCQILPQLPTLRELARGSVSRHGHGPQISAGPRFPIRVVELAPPRD